MCSRGLIILFIAIFFAGIALAEDNAFNFADNLYDSGDYQQAIMEYKRVLFSSTHKIETGKIQLKLAKAYFKNHQPMSAERVLNNLVEHNEYVAEEAQRELARQYYAREFYNFAAIEYKDCGETYNNSESLYLAGWAYLRDAKYDEANEIFTLFDNKKESDYYFAAQKLKNMVLEGKSLPQKNPGIAKVMSYVVPGTGQMYSENWGDGFVSFFLNALTISLLANAVNTNQTGEALIWLTLESAWYFGGAYSAENSAHKYNNAIKEKYFFSLEKDYNVHKLFQD